MICKKCGKEFPDYLRVNGEKFEGRHRKFCFECCPKGKKIKWRDETLVNKIKDLVKECFSIAQVLRKLGIKVAGGNYYTIKNIIKEYNIDTKHFTGKLIGRGKSHNTSARYSLQEILAEGFSYNSDKLRKRLIKEGLFEAKCYKCNNTEWMGQSIPLELEHINGKHDDNRIENLTILCPNCHAQTKFYRGKNKKSS